MWPPDVDALAAAVIAKDRLRVAEALNLAEDRREAAREHVAALVDALRRRMPAEAGHRIGFTGPPGVGKSTLAAAVAKEFRARGNRVAIMAVDPSSAVSGGSLLGDRARMGSLSLDEGSFVRSYATAGELGGLTSTCYASLAVLSAAFDRVLVETVGVGQSEIDVRMLVDTVVLVVQPGSGDTLQFLKSGVMEIPDVVVVQKADHEALASQALADLASALRSLGAAGVVEGELPAFATSAATGRGITELVSALEDRHARITPGLAQARADGDVAFARRELERLHGHAAIELAGGRAALEASFRAARSSGASALTLAREAAERHVAKLVASYTEPLRKPS